MGENETVHENAWETLVAVTTTLIGAAVVATLWAEVPSDPTSGLSLLLAVATVALAVLASLQELGRWPRPQLA